jgi:hypothetical protein
MPRSLSTARIVYDIAAPGQSIGPPREMHALGGFPFGSEGENSDTRPLPPGTARVETLFVSFGVGILLLLLLSAIVILIRSRRR